MSTNEIPGKVWTIGVDDDLLVWLDKHYQVELTQMSQNPSDIYDLEARAPDLILTGEQLPVIKRNELLQILTLKFAAETKVYHILTSQKDNQRKRMLTDGASDVFFLPFDQNILEESLTKIMPTKSKTESQDYRAVSLVDISPESKLDFDVSIYMPNNKKYICFCRKGLNVGEKRMDRMQNRVSSVYVHSDDIEKFYDYSANQLKEIKISQNLSQTEKRQRMNKAVRALLADAFEEPEAKNEGTENQKIDASSLVFLKDCKKIVSRLVNNSGESDWHKKFMESFGKNQDYSYQHAGNVSTYAALFSLGLGIGDPEELAIAGLLHDLGMAFVPEKLHSMPYESLTPSEKTVFQKHVAKTIEVLKKKNYILSDVIMNIIVQHHEKYCGGGYPKGLKGDQINKESQVLALADRFDELTSIRQGKKLLNPREAIEYLNLENNKDPKEKIFHPGLLGQVLELFPLANSKKGAA